MISAFLSIYISVQDYWRVAFDATENIKAKWQVCSYNKWIMDEATTEMLEMDLGCPYGSISPPNCYNSAPDVSGQFSSAGSGYTDKIQKNLAAMGYNLNEFRHLLIALPETSCSWSGLAVVPGRISWYNGDAFDRYTIMHELGEC